ncbi:MAG: EndoU domain-containing protein [Thiothrix litoralis]
MKHLLWKTAVCITLTLSGLTTAFAQVTLPQPRAFVVEQPCEAYTSLRKKSYPVTLEVGKTYRATAENKQPDATHAAITVGAENKWVALSCGHYATHAAAAPAPETPANTDTACLPFFDNIDNPVKINVGGNADITPPAPALNAFDLAVNDTCGAPGKVVSVNEFQTLLRKHPDVLQRLQAFTQNRVYANRPAPASSEAYLQDLSDAWFNLKAFDHIFCGEPKAGSAIGGLHFYGRYVQLQASGDACRMSNFRQNEVVPGVLYSMGATMKAANGGIARSSIKGYGLTLNAEDILKAATRAFADNPTNSAESTACLLPITDDGAHFTTVFVRRANGIRTFYPDATPAANDPKCSAALNLAG